MITTRDRAQELGKRLGLESMERAYRAGMNLSRWLEEQDPSAEYTDGLDAFERQLALHGITTTTNRERGFYADRFEKFEEVGEAGRALQIEWMARQYRKVAGMTRKKILTLRRRGLDPRAISGQVRKDYWLTVYSGDVIRWLDDVIRWLEAREAVARIKGKDRVERDTRKLRQRLSGRV